MKNHSIPDRAKLLALLLSACLLPTVSPAIAAPSAGAGTQSAPAAPNLNAGSRTFSTISPVGGATKPFSGVPYAGVSVVGQGAVSNVADNVARYNAGSVNALDTPKIEQTFLVKNSTGAPLTIDHVQPSCSCTTAVLGKSGAPAKLAPAGQASVRVTVDLKDVPPGDFDKSVFVYLAGSIQAVAVLEIAGELIPSVTISPALIDFGQVAVGQPHILQVIAKIDPRLAAKGHVPLLVSSDPALQIREEPQVTIIPKSSGGVPAKGRTWVRVGSQSVEVTPQPANSMLTRTYRVIIPPKMPLGPINATLFLGSSSFGMGGPATTETDQAGANASSILRTATVLVVGTVTGDISAQPQRLAFGMVPFGQATARQILLTEVRANALKDARVMTASPWLSARLITADGQVNPFTAPVSATSLQPTSGYSYQMLQVSLSPQAPPGNLTSQVKIMLANGEQLIIPVNGFVSSNG